LPTPSTQKNEAPGEEIDIRALAKQYKQQASALLHQHPANAEAIMVFMQTCDEIMYAPLASVIAPETLHEMYAALQQHT
jgi:long-subunit acyl-CoA synthetase (AMP-forming)